jgi:hypothetical protein
LATPASRATVERRSLALTVSAEIEIDAPTAAVYAVLAGLAAYREWNPQVTDAVGEIAAGNRVRLRMAREAGRAFRIRPRVIVANPGAELRLRGRVPLLFSGEHRFQLIPRDDGSCTHVIQSETYRGLIVPFIGRTLKPTQGDFEQHNKALKQRVEQLR